jgi:hypothetical protein
VSVPGDGTGTPWEEDIVNDLFGWQQQLLDAAGITPSGNPDKKSVSQYYDAMRLTGGYPGLVVPMAINVDPATLGMRVLLLDGSGVLRANYPDLDTRTYVGDSANPTAGAFYRADDAAGTARNITGAYLILPDARGCFPRGLDTTGTVDPDGASRTLGDEQAWAMRNHYHTMVDKTTGNVYKEYLTDDVTPGSTVLLMAQKPTGVPAYAESVQATDYGAIASVNKSTDETRPVNFAVNWGVWY